MNSKVLLDMILLNKDRHVLEVMESRQCVDELIIVLEESVFLRVLFDLCYNDTYFFFLTKAAFHL